MNRLLIAFLFLSIFLVSCKDKFEQESNAVARVNDSYLYKKDLAGLVDSGIPEEDSIAIVQNFEQRWATQRLLLDAAEFNLSDDKKEEINVLVEQFKVDLLTSAYLEIMVQQSIDTVVSESELLFFYENNKNNFVAKDKLVQLCYINVSANNPKISLIRKYFTSGKKEELKKLEDLSLQIKNYTLNDSTWVKVEDVYDKFPFIKPDNINNYLSDGTIYEETEADDLYIVRVNKVLNKNSIYPYDYIKPALVQTLISNRKMELIKKIQKDILDDANKNNQYEVYK